MSGPWEEFSKPAADDGPWNEFSNGDAKKQNKGIVGDLVTDLKRGVQNLPGTLSGIGDMVVAPVVGDAIVSKGWDLAGKKTGFQPSKWAKEATAEYSDQRKAGNESVEKAWEDNSTPFKDAASGDFSGIGNVAKAYASNPGVIAGSVAESAPAIVLGGAIGKGVGVVSKMSPIASTWIGEGAVAGGQQMASLTEEGVDARTASNASLATSVGVGALGAGGGKIAKRFGLTDIDTALAGGAFRGVAKETADATLKGSVKEAAKRIAGGAVSEGVFEELPQSALEQTLSNLAQGKPWDDGIARASVEGTLAGSLMGGAFNAIPGRKPESAPSTDPVVDNKQAIAGLLPSPTYTGTPGGQLVESSAERQAAIDKAQSDSDAIWAARDEYERQQEGYRQRPAPTIITDPEPIQQRINALMGIDEGRLSEKAKADYEKAVENAFNEKIGVVVGENSLEIPFTMGDYLKSKVAAADIARDKPKAESANQQAVDRLGQLSSEESQQQPDIPVVGTLSRIANLGIRSGAIQRQGDSPAIQQAAPIVQQTQFQAASSAPTSIDLSKRTDGQLSYLANNGKSGFREAAIAEIKRRGQTNATQAQPLAQKTTQANDAQVGFEQAAAQKSEGVAPAQQSIPPEIVSRVAKRTDKELAFMGRVNRDPVVREAIAMEMATRAADNGRSNEQQADAGLLASAAVESRAAPKLNAQKPRNYPMAKRDDLVGAIMRVTNGQGISAGMAQTITGDKAGSGNAKLRGLFTNQGTADLGDIAELLKVEEGYSVRDGDHLAELVREASAGNMTYSMERTEREASENAVKQYRGNINKRAEELGLKRIGGKRTLEMVEADIAAKEKEIAEIEAQQEREAIQAANIVEDGEVSEAEFMALFSKIADYTEDEINAAIVRSEDKANQQAEARSVEISEREAQGNSQQGDGVGAKTEGTGNVEAGARGTAEGFDLTQQTNAQAADQFAQQQAGESADPTKYQADMERDAVPFSLAGQSQPKPQGVQTGLFTADGRVSSEAVDQSPDNLSKNPQKLDASPERVKETAKNEQVEAKKSEVDFIEAPNGSLEFGAITEEIGKSIRRQAGSIRLREGNDAWGRAHIEMRHGKDILNLGYSGVPEFVSDIAGNFDAIYSGDGSTLVIAKLDKPHGKMNVVLELEKNSIGNIEYYDVKNATPIRADQFKNKTPIWTKEKPLVDTVGPNGSSAEADPLIPRGSSGSSSLDNQQSESKPAKETDSGVMLYNIAENETPIEKEGKRWGSTVDDFFAGKISKSESPVILRSTPASLQALGLPDYEIRTSLANGVEDAMYNHGIKPSQLKAIPLAMADPQAIFVNQGADGKYSLNVLTGMFVNGKQIAIALQPSKYGVASGPVHFVATITPRESGVFAKMAENGQLVYAGNNMSDDVKRGLNKSKMKYGQSAIDLKALIASKFDSTARTSKVVYKSDLVNLIKAGQAQFSANGDVKISPADKAIYGMAAEGKSASDILKFIASASRSPFNRQVAKLLMKTGIAPTITVGDGKGWKMNAGEGHKYAAAYNPKTDTVALFKPSASERHMLHELMHAATLQALKKRGLASIQMNALFNHVKRSGALKGQYGMTDVDEFIAEAFSNPKFQALLKQVSAPQSSAGKASSAWNWFVRIVRGIMGIPQGQENALSRALEIGVEVMREDMTLRNRDVTTSENETPRYAIGGRNKTGRFAPSGHAKYVSELKSVLMKLTSSDKETRDKASATYFKVMDVPPVIRNIIAKDGSKPFKRLEQGIWGSGSSIASKATDTHAISRHGSVIDSKVVINLPQLIADPIAVFSSEGGQNENSYRVVVPGAVVAIEPKGLRGFVMTVHPLSVKSVQRWSDAGLLHYVNEKAALSAAESGVLSMGQSQQFTSSDVESQTVVSNQSQILAVDWSMARTNAVRNGRTVMTSDDIEALPDSAIRYNVADEGWSVSEPSKMDDLIYSLQDKHIDMKRVVQSIFKTGKKVRDEVNAYLQEELFHGRAAKGVKDFLDFELRPLLQEMMRNKIDMGDFEEYLWNAHAQERNEQIAKVNPEMNDGGSGIKTADAKAYLSGLSAERNQIFESLAAKVEAMNRNSQGILVSSGLEKQETIDAWNGAYQHYVPLQREDVDSGHIGTGKGFSVRGSSTKRAMGSGRQVVDIIANLTMQRERNIVRAEKNRVSNALMGLAMENPNADFWTVDKAPTERVVEETAIYTVNDESGKKLEEFTRMSEAERFAKQHPGSEIEQSWGDRVKERIMPGFKSRDNVLLTRVNGEDHYVIFNERDERAMRMATAMKNLDADNLGRVLSVVGKATRYLASINTQFNPVFGVINLIRDTQGALINLSSTPIAGDQKKVLGYTKDALIGIYKDIRAHRAGKKPSSDWAELFEEFQKEGGQTGYRDQYANAEQRAEAIQSELKQFKEGGAKRLVRGVFGWLSDYNETMENAVRLATYKAAKERGVSKQQAASIAKSITVNFNRKGQVATQVGALYAFFNASVQGSARLAQTLFEQSDGDAKTIRLSKTGKKIMAGGIMLGSMQALLLAAAGFDDDEPPEFIRERNLILPIGDGKYLTLAMPLGFHVIPGIGRIATEFVLSGGKDPIKRMASLFSMFAESFNPVGNAGFSLQTIAPSVVDPFAALAENRDFTGKEIYRENFNALNPTPGHARAKDVASVWSRYISEALNFITGGSEFKPGAFSPSPDAIDYLIGQVAGGVGREANKVAQTAGATWSGEDLPLYKIPLVGRFIGDTEGQSGQSAKFYDAIKQINMHEAEYKGLIGDGRSQEASEYLAENPAVKLIMLGNQTERVVRNLRSKKRKMIDSEASQDSIKAIDERITETMARFNERVSAVI